MQVQAGHRVPAGRILQRRERQLQETGPIRGELRQPIQRRTGRRSVQRHHFCNVSPQRVLPEHLLDCIRRGKRHPEDLVQTRGHLHGQGSQLCADSLVPAPAWGETGRREDRHCVDRRPVIKPCQHPVCKLPLLKKRNEKEGFASIETHRLFHHII